VPRDAFEQTRTIESVTELRVRMELAGHQFSDRPRKSEPGDDPRRLDRGRCPTQDRPDWHDVPRSEVVVVAAGRAKTSRLTRSSNPDASLPWWNLACASSSRAMSSPIGSGNTRPAYCAAASKRLVVCSARSYWRSTGCAPGRPPSRCLVIDIAPHMFFPLRARFVRHARSGSRNAAGSSLLIARDRHQIDPDGAGRCKIDEGASTLMPTCPQHEVRGAVARLKTTLRRGDRSRRREARDSPDIPGRFR
jgi:hypothetical protein